jgi:hypothetical protein
MTDVEAIAATKARYCMTADLCASDPVAARTAMAGLFAPDATGDYGYGVLTGSDAVAGFLTTSIAASSLWMLHMLHTPLVVIDGDAAQCDWTVLVYCKRRESQAIDTIVGRYSDTFRRDASGTWRIAHVRFARSI